MRRTYAARGALVGLSLLVASAGAPTLPGEAYTSRTAVDRQLPTKAQSSIYCAEGILEEELTEYLRMPRQA